MTLLGVYDMRLECDYPGCREIGYYTDDQTDAQARKTARRDGWSIGKTNHFCPKHCKRKLDERRRNTNAEDA